MLKYFWNFVSEILKSYFFFAEIFYDFCFRSLKNYFLYVKVF